MAATSLNHQVLDKLIGLYEEVFLHDGYGELKVEMRIQKAGQKEVILHCGKQHRFVVDYKNKDSNGNEVGYKVIKAKALSKQNKYKGRAERRAISRRDQFGKPRDFKLERRISKERRES